MKSTTLAFLLPAVISAAALDPRQAPKAATTYTFATKDLKPQFRANSKRTLTRIGPHVLQPGNTGRHGISLDSNGQGIMFSIPKDTFCGGECTVLSGKVGVEFEDGTPADVSKGVYIHHILATNSQKKIQPFVSTCDTQGDVQAMRRPSQISAGFVGVSDDNGNEPITYGTRDGKIEGGYWISKGDAFGIWADLVNLDSQNKTIYVSYDLEYLPGHVGSDAQGSLTSVTGCLARRIETPATGPANTTSGKFRLFREGYLVNGKGHLHDGGVAMDLYINDKFVCSSDAVYGGESGTTVQNGQKWETISGMTLCPGPYKIKDGDYMSMTARYDLSKHPLRENGDHKMAEVMGMWTMNFISGVAPANATKST